MSDIDNKERFQRFYQLKGIIMALPVVYNQQAEPKRREESR